MASKNPPNVPPSSNKPAVPPRRLYADPIPEDPNKPSAPTVGAGQHLPPLKSDHELFGVGSRTTRAISIAGRMVFERERLLGMSEKERAWRKQWLKDQVLDHDEPREPANYYEERFNPLRRFYRWPLEQLERALRPQIGNFGAEVVRYGIGRTVLGVMCVYYLYYQFKYNQGGWMRAGGWRVMTGRPVMLPSHPDFPNFYERQADDYAEFGFKRSIFY